MAIDIESFLKLNWRQGAILPHKLSQTIANDLTCKFDATSGDLLLVVSHDCDVNARSFTDEPNVELIIARKAAKDGNKRMGKSSRYLQLELNSSSDCYEMRAQDRFVISRKLLSEYSPEDNLSEENRGFLSEWLARRYSRSAFPNSFDARLEPYKEKIKKCLKSVAHDIFGIYFQLSQGEIADSETYNLIGFAVMLDADHRDSAKLDRVTKAVTKLQGLLNEAKIEFAQDIGVVSDKEFTLEDIRLTNRWDWDVLSYDEGQASFVAV